MEFRRSKAKRFLSFSNWSHLVYENKHMAQIAFKWKNRSTSNGETPTIGYFRGWCASFVAPFEMNSLPGTLVPTRQSNMSHPTAHGSSDDGKGPMPRRVIKYSFWSQSSALFVKSARNQVRSVFNCSLPSYFDVQMISDQLCDPIAPDDARNSVA